MEMKLEDNFARIEATVNRHLLIGLERCGLEARSNAQQILTDNDTIDTGALRNNIAYEVDAEKKEVIIGTDIEYAPYIEYGTGIYAKGGRTTAWRWKDRDGNWHTTHGQEAQPFIKPAVEEYRQSYQNILNDQLRKLNAELGNK